MVETVVSRKGTSSRISSAGRAGGREISSKPIALSSVNRISTKRVSTRISELDRVLGGGLVSGQVVLIAGEPGIGKSTLLLQVADKLSDYGLRTSARKKKAVDGRPSTVVYVSGEESVTQIKVRADRLGVKKKTIQIMEETDIDSVIDLVENQKSLPTNYHLPTTIIVDSIQTMRTSDLSGMAGSVGQVRECAYRLVRLAKSQNIPTFIVGHVTKEGSVAGPAVLAHLVDTVLWFEGDKSLTLRILRAMKNRFGPTDEVGIFSMEDKGLISMSNPEKLFLTKGQKAVAGSVVSSVMRGTRPILVEVQSLVVSTKLAFARCIAQGFDPKRLEMLLAVLTRRCGLPMYKYDCFVNIAGGISVKNDPSVDLAVCLSIASAYFDKPLSKNTIAVGEVGLLGDVREVIAQDKRIKEARRLGYRNTISSKESKYLQGAIKKYLH